MRHRFIYERSWDVYPYSESSAEFRRRVRILDKYVLSLALWPMLGSLGVTLVALLLERILRLLDLQACISVTCSSYHAVS